MALPGPLNDPVIIAVITLVVAAVTRWQMGLSWTEYRQVHRLKRRFFPLLDRVSPGGFDSFVNEKGYRDDDEYFRTESRSVKAVWKTLVRQGGSPHLVSSIKRREAPDGSDLSAAHVVWTHDDGTQTEAYLFENGDGSTDIYVHHETATTDVDGHLSDPQTDGDPRGVVTKALAATGN
jgi:hypothetical protein